MSIQSEQIFDKMNQNKTNLVDQDLLTITLIAFCVFILRLRRSDLVFSSIHVKVFIEKTKTHIYREGIIAASLKKINMTLLHHPYS